MRHPVARTNPFFYFFSISSTPSFPIYYLSYYLSSLHFKTVMDLLSVSFLSNPHPISCPCEHFQQYIFFVRLIKWAVPGGERVGSMFIIAVNWREFHFDKTKKTFFDSYQPTTDPLPHFLCDFPSGHDGFRNWSFQGKMADRRKQLMINDLLDEDLIRRDEVERIRIVSNKKFLFWKEGCSTGRSMSGSN